MAARALTLAAALALLIAPGAAAQVAYVGDSLGVGTVPPLRERLPDMTIDADVESGRHSTEGVAELQGLLGPEHQALVFDLGTNDDPAAPGVLAADLASAAELAGPRCLVVATLNRPPVNGVTIDGLNRVVRRFVASTPTARLVDWHRTASRDPALLFDGIHASPTGYALRADLFARQVRRCGAGSAPAPAPEPPSTGAPRPKRQRTKPARPPDPLRQLASELARTVAIGAEFG